MAGFRVGRIGVILAVRDVDRSVAFYRDHLGFAVEALYDDPPYATLSRDGVRLSVAEQGHPAPDRPGAPGHRRSSGCGGLARPEYVDERL